MPVYDYDEKGCTKSIRECDMCSKNLDNDIKSYNRNTFFVYALIGFVLIILGLYVAPLLVQIVTLPAGAVLVIQAAMENFDDKLLVIITFALLIIAAVVLAVRKLK
jgi:amino acid transporter